MVKKKGNVDNWKKKRWFSILADSTFDEKEIGSTIAIEGKSLVGRTIKIALKDLTNNIKDSYFEIAFKIDKVIGSKAETIIQQFEAKQSMVRRLTRRSKSKVEIIFYATTKDKKKLKLKVVFITGAKFPTIARTEARKVMVDNITKEIEEKTLKEAWPEIIFQQLSEKVKKSLGKLGYVNKITVIKAVLI
ncbi:MAG: hypothetical protein V1824_00285 [archaeon]